jgi:hypothetical protein
MNLFKDLIKKYGPPPLRNVFSGVEEWKKKKQTKKKK